MVIKFIAIVHGVSSMSRYLERIVLGFLRRADAASENSNSIPIQKTNLNVLNIGHSMKFTTSSRVLPRAWPTSDFVELPEKDSHMQIRLFSLQQAFHSLS